MNRVKIAAARVARLRALAKGRTYRELGLWAGLILLVLTERTLQGERGVPWLFLLAGVCALAVAGALARVAPLVSWLLVGAVALTQVSNLSISPPFLLSYVVALVVVSYRIGRSVDSVRGPLLGFSFSVLAGLLVAVAAGVLGGGSLPQIANNLLYWFYFVAALLFLGVLPWLAGRYRRLYAGLISAGWERARQLEREQEITAEQERLRERARIAQDMHDSLGHALSLIALRAGVFEVDPAVDQRCREFAGDMRLAVTNATKELRAVVGVLRHDLAPAPVEPVHESVAELVDRTRESGLAVQLEHEGEPVELAPLADRAAYRVVQESLTNVTKHAPGARVLVKLDYHADQTEVTVTNGPAPGSPPVSAVQGRRGLIGLEERVRLAGGEFAAEPHDGGFRVTARLPHGEGIAVRTSAGAAGEAGSPAARGMARAQRRIRWRLVKGIALPVGISAAATMLVLGVYAVWVFNTVLSRADFDRLSIGETREQVEKSLPAFALSAPELTGEVPQPAAASCRYYLTGAAIVPAPESLYRLCFRNDQLVGKDFVRIGLG